MSKVVDVRSSGGDFVILGKALVLPSSSTDGADLPLDGSIRFNPDSEVVEVYLQNNWAPIMGSGEGGSAAHNHTSAQITDLAALLGGKASVVHVHPINEVTGLQSALDSKTAVGHQHAISDVVSLQASLDTLQTQINGKTATGHTHTVANVTGLQTALDGKAPTQHLHTFLQVDGLQAHIDKTKMGELTVCLPGKPAANARVAVTTARRIDIPANFVGSFCRMVNIPTAPVAITVKNNSVTVGTINISTSGAATLSTSSGVGIIMNPGDTLSFTFPAIPDDTLDTVSFCIYGERK
jgi:hypothetical protein